MLSALLSALALGLPQSGPDAEFRALLRSMAQERGIAVRVSRARTTELGMLPEEMVVQLDYEGPGVFKIQTMGAFGDGQTIVSDGKRVLRDPLEGEFVYSSPSPKGLGLAQGLVSVRNGLPLAFALLDGESVFGSLLSADAKVESKPEGTATAFTFSLASGSRGTVVVEGGRVVRTMLDNSAGGGQGGFRNRPGELVDEVVEWRRAKFPRGHFELRPPAGTKVVEESGS